MIRPNIYLKQMKTCPHKDIYKYTQMFMKIGKLNMVYPYSGMLFSNKTK